MSDSDSMRMRSSDEEDSDRGNEDYLDNKYGDEQKKVKE